MRVSKFATWSHNAWAKVILENHYYSTNNKKKAYRIAKNMNKKTNSDYRKRLENEK